MRFRNHVGAIQRRFKVHYNINGCPVCAGAWYTYHGLCKSDARVKRVLASIRGGDNEWEPLSGEKKLGRPDERGMAATTWMRQYIIDYGDQMPTECVFRLDPVTILDLHGQYTRHARVFDKVGT